MLLSIIIPVYNQEELVIRCLDSIPVSEDIEVIAVDDNSTDRTLEVLNNYSRDNMLVYHQDKNLGPGIARNAGLDVAKGDYIMFLDSDDYIYPNVLTALLAKIKYLDLHTDIIWVPRERNDGYHWISPYSLQGCLVRREFIGDTRHIDKYNGEDTHFLNQLLYKPHTELKLDTVMYHYNLGEGDCENALHKHKR